MCPRPKHANRFNPTVSRPLIFGGAGNFPDNGARVATAIVTLICNSVQKAPKAAKPSAQFPPAWTHILTPRVTWDSHAATFHL